MMYQTYNPHKSYDENIKSGKPFEGDIPDFSLIPHKYDLFGHKLMTLTGVPAGTLPNADYIITMAHLGASIPTYKTVRVVHRNCLPFPNCVAVDLNRQLSETDIGARAIALPQYRPDTENLTITNSFGMPSLPADEWSGDIEKANKNLLPGQVMIVSVVGTPNDNAADMQADLINDYAVCAARAREAGAKIIELNFSCPNVRKDLGSIYQDETLSANIVAAVKKAVPNIPVLIKVGYMSDMEKLRTVMKAVTNAGVDGIVGINTIPMKVYNADNTTLPLPGRETSGLCGFAISDLSENFTKMMLKVREQEGMHIKIGSCGGITSPAAFQKRLDLGADFALSATASMFNPMLFKEYIDTYVRPQTITRGGNLPKTTPQFRIRY
ncbi:MAG: tRNA-dihydrouridine synthase [Lactobacillales bacterium]|jgi:dihydroorotate dehydrogenase|nr:tRNA-dihydrouridine synthase [Lactobacillales bacterium]